MNIQLVAVDYAFKLGLFYITDESVHYFFSELSICLVIVQCQKQ